MTVEFVCPDCRSELAVPDEKVGDRVRCGVCRSRILVPDRSAAARARELVSAGRKAGHIFQRLYRAFIKVDWLLPPAGLRFCPDCQTHAIDHPRLCECGRPTVGLSLLEQAAGPRVEVQPAVTEALDWRARLPKLQLAGLVVVGLFVLGLVFTQSLLTLLVYGPILVGLVGLGVFSALAGLKLWLTWSFGRRLPDPRTVEGLRVGRMEDMERRFLLPFLDRHGATDRHEVAGLEAELPMLEKLLAREGFEDLSGELGDDLIATALRRDLRRFFDAMDFLDAERGGDDPHEAWCLYLEATQGRAEPLEFFRQWLAERGEPSDPASIEAGLAAVRERLSLDAFARDLAERADGAPRRRVTLEAVDAMDPYNFELLLGMIYGALGYQVEETPKSGDQGADVIVTMADLKTVIQAKLYRRPVGNAAVQQVLAAKAYWSCSRAMVVTNSTFTAPARELAERGKIELIDREGLGELLDAFHERERNEARLELLLRPCPRAEDDELLARAPEHPADPAPEGPPGRDVEPESERA